MTVGLIEFFEFEKVFVFLMIIKIIK